MKNKALVAILHDTSKWLEISIIRAKPMVLSNSLEAYRAHIKLMSEYVEGIANVLDEALVTSSMALLRCLIEASVNLQWIAKEPLINEDKYFNDRMPSIQKRFNQIGYKDEYKYVYVFLNKRIHGNYDASLDRINSSVSRLEVVPSLSYRSINNVFVGPDGMCYKEEILAMTDNVAINNWAPFICGKSLDYILSTLVIVFGEDVRHKKWWNNTVENILLKLKDENKEKIMFVYKYNSAYPELRF